VFLMSDTPVGARVSSFGSRGFRIQIFGFLVHIFNIQIPFIDFWGSGSWFKLRVHGWRVLVSDLQVQVSSLEFQLSGFEFRFWVFGFRVSGFGFRVSGVGCRILGDGCRVSRFGCRVKGVLADGGTKAIVKGHGHRLVEGLGLRVWG
jgi:hypothetical protein